jgi:hypothetical protein
MGTGETLMAFLVTQDFQQFVLTPEVFLHVFNIVWHNLTFLVPYSFWLTPLLMFAVVSLIPFIWILREVFFPKI